MVEDVLARPGAFTGDDVDDAVRQDASRRCISSRTLRDVVLDGLRMIVQPAARAGASFQAAMRKGKFQGMIWPTTPIGSWMTRLSVWSSSVDARPSSLRRTPAK